MYFLCYDIWINKSDRKRANFYDLKFITRFKQITKHLHYKIWQLVMYFKKYPLITVNKQWTAADGSAVV